MTRLSSYASFAIVLLLWGCTFQPEGDVITEIKIPEPVPIHIDFFKQTDTLLVRGSPSYSVTIKSNEPVKSYQVLVDGTEVNQGEGAPWHVSFNSRDIADGIHTLKLVLTKRRIGKSMGAQLGLETYQQEFTRTIEIYNKPIVASPVTTSIEDGALVLRWQPYTGYRFEQYYIFASGPNFGSWIIEDPRQTSVRIDNFLAGKTEFQFFLRAFNEESKSSVAYESFFNAAIEKTPSGLKYSWAGSPFNSCTGFQITLDANGVHKEVTFPNSANLQELACSYVFPHDVSTEIFALGADGRKISIATLSSNSIQKIGGSSPAYHPFHKFVRPASDKSVLFVYYLDANSETYESRSRVAIYNRTTGEELALKTNLFAISPDGKSIFHIGGSNGVAKLDPATLDELENVPLNSVITTAPNSLWQFHASNDGKLLVYVTPTGNRRFFVYDWTTRASVFSEAMTFGYGVHRSGLLGDGGRKFYNLDNSQVISVDTNPAEYFYLHSFAKETPLPHTHTSVRWLDPGTLILKSLTDMSTILQVSYPHRPLDIISNYQNEFGIVYSHNGRIKIDFFDQHTLTLLTTLETQMTSATNYKFRLADNELFVFHFQYGKNGPLHHTLVDFKR